MAFTIAAHILDVDVARPEMMYKTLNANPPIEWVIVAVSSVDTNPYLLVNQYSGDLDLWAEIAITEWTNPATAVLGLGDFILAASTAEAELIRSDDLGVTRTQIAPLV